MNKELIEQIQEALQAQRDTIERQNQIIEWREQEIARKNKDIAQGYKRVKDEGDDDNRFNNWRVTNRKILDSDKNLRKHVVKIVDKSDNHPVRLGKQSLRFEVRDGNGWG